MSAADGNAVRFIYQQIESISIKFEYFYFDVFGPSVVGGEFVGEDDAAEEIAQQVRSVVGEVVFHVLFGGEAVVLDFDVGPLGQLVHHVLDGGCVGRPGQRPTQIRFIDLIR